MKKFEHQLIICIVNNGFTDVVMDAARSAGATGGTVVTAKGTANPEAEKFFSITIQPDKEMVMILVDDKIKDDVLHALYKEAGLNTPGQGIAFALPVDNVVGISKPTDEAKKILNEEKTETKKDEEEK